MPKTPTTTIKSRKRWWCYLRLHLNEVLVRADFGYYWVCPDCRTSRLVFQFTE